MLTIASPGAVPYTGNYVSFPAPTLSAPPEGNRTIPVEIMWITDGGAQRTIHFNARSRQVQELSQIAGIHVDNTRCRGTVTMIFPDTGFEVVLGGTLEGYYPVVTNGLEFYITLSVNPTAQDVTILQVLNFIPPPITFGTAPAGAPPVGSVSEVDSGVGLTGGPITTVGTLSLETPVTIANGGTNASTAPAARTQLGLGTIAVRDAPLSTLYGGTGVNNLPGGNLVGAGGVGAPFVGVPTPLAVGYGGTGATTLTPSGSLLLGSGTAAVRTSQLMTQTSDAAGLQMRSAGTVVGSPYFDFYWASSGTLGAPGPTQSNDNLGGVYAGGADSNGWSNGGECAVLCYANANWTPTSHPTRIVLGTTSPGATAPTPRLEVWQGVRVGPVPDMGHGTLNAQALYVNGAVPGGGYPVSWLAGVNPNNAVILIAQRAMTITAIYAVVRVVAGGTATVDVMNGAGTRVNSVTLNANAPGFLNMGVAIPTLAAQDYLVLQTAGTAWTAGIGNITVFVA